MPEEQEPIKPRPAHLWKPGQSGNPGGRPKGRSLKALLREALEADDGSGRTVAQAMLDALLLEARTGNVPAIREVFDRAEGKAVPAPEEKGEKTVVNLLDGPDDDEPSEAES